MKNLGQYLGIAFELTGLIIVFLYVGKYFDEKYTLNGIGIAVGVFLALIIWVLHLIYMVKQWEKQDSGS